MPSIVTLPAVESSESFWFPWTAARLTRANISRGAVPNQPNDGVPESDSVFGSEPAYSAVDEDFPHLFVESRGHFVSEFNNVDPAYQYVLSWPVLEPKSAFLGIPSETFFGSSVTDPDPSSIATTPTDSAFPFNRSADFLKETSGGGWSGGRRVFRVQCTDGTTDPNVFRASSDNGSTWTEGLEMSVYPTTVEVPTAGTNVGVGWVSTTGFEAGDHWDFVVGERLATLDNAFDHPWRVTRIDLWGFFMARRRVVDSLLTVPLRVRLMKQTASSDDLAFEAVEEVEFAGGTIAASDRGQSWSSALSVSSHFWDFTPSPTERYSFQVVLAGDPSLDRIERRFTGISVWYTTQQLRKAYVD